jgi:hypothetical protein
MVRTYVPMVRYLGCAPGWALALPASAALYTAMTVSSAWRHHRGRGAAWKGRAYGASAAVGLPEAVDQTTPAAESRASSPSSMPSQST